MELGNVDPDNEEKSAKWCKKCNVQGDKNVRDCVKCGGKFVESISRRTLLSLTYEQLQGDDGIQVNKEDEAEENLSTKIGEDASNDLSSSPMPVENVWDEKAISSKCYDEKVIKEEIEETQAEEKKTGLSGDQQDIGSVDNTNIGIKVEENVPIYSSIEPVHLKQQNVIKVEGKSDDISSSTKAVESTWDEGAESNKTNSNEGNECINDDNKFKTDVSKVKCEEKDAELVHECEQKKSDQGEYHNRERQISSDIINSQEMDKQKSISGHDDDVKIDKEYIMGILGSTESETKQKKITPSGAQYQISYGQGHPYNLRSRIDSSKSAEHPQADNGTDNSSDCERTRTSSCPDHTNKPSYSEAVQKKPADGANNLSKSAEHTQADNGEKGLDNSSDCVYTSPSSYPDHTNKPALYSDTVKKKPDGNKNLNNPSKEEMYRHQYGQQSNSPSKQGSNQHSRKGGSDRQATDSFLITLKFSVFMTKSDFFDFNLFGNTKLMVWMNRPQPRGGFLIEMYPERFPLDDPDLQLFTGQLKVSEKWLGTGISYKYVIGNGKGEKYWEFLHNACTWATDQFTVNRYLTVGEFSRENGIHYQFDDITLFVDKYKTESKGIWSGIVTLLKKAAGSNANSMSNKPETWIQKTFSAYLSILINRNNATLYDEESPSICNQVLQWYGLVQSYGNSLCCPAVTGRSVCWEKIHRWEVLNCFTQFLEEQLNKNMVIIKTSKLLSTELYGVLKNVGILAFISITLHPGEWSHELISRLFIGVSLEGQLLSRESCLLDLISKEFGGKNKWLIQKIIPLWNWSIKSLPEKHSINFCYPLVFIHILSNRCLPYAKPTVAKAKATITLEWCGLGFCEVKHFNARFLDNLFKNLDKIKTSLEIDALLRRSVAYLMKPRHYPCLADCDNVPSRLITKFMIHLVKKGDLYLKDDIAHFAVTLNIMKKYVGSEVHHNKFLLYMNALLTLVEESSKKCRIRDDSILYYSNLVDYIREYYSCYWSSSESHIKVTVTLDDKLLRTANELKENFLKVYSWSTMDTKDIYEEIKLVNQLVELELTKFPRWGQVVGIFIDVLQKKADKLLKFGDKPSYFEVQDMLDKEKDMIHTDVWNKLDDIFASFLEKYLKTSKHLEPSIYERIFLSRAAMKNFGDIVKNDWPIKKSLKEKLHKLLNWSAVFPYLKCYCHCDAIEQLPKIFQQVVEDIVKTIKLISHAIVDFDAQIGLLRLINGKEKVLCDLYGVIVDKYSSNFTVNDISNSMEKASSILESFYKFQSYVQNLVNICNDLPGGVVDVEELLEKVGEDISFKTIRNLCENDEAFILTSVTQTNKESDLTECKPDDCRVEITDVKADEIKFQSYYNIPNEYVPIMKRLDHFKASGIRLFMKYCRRCCEDSKFSNPQQTLVFTELFGVTFQPCLDQLAKDVSHILCGEISGEDLKRFFPVEYKEKEISHELKHLCDLLDFRENVDVRNITDCASKIKCLFDFENSFEVANRILKVAKRLQLGGNFETTEFIYSQQKELKDISLKSVDKSFIGDIEKLQTVTREMEEIFSVVADCLPLIEWLREELKDPKEVKTFVDLMSIAAGESDLEVKRVSCFEASCQAFAPIIFDLNAESGFNELLDACNKVLVAKEKDPDITQKLIDTNRFRMWYEEARKSQGSVEKKSIKQTQVANRYGKYIIGNITGDDDYFISHEATLNDVIHLDVSESDIGEDEQMYVKTFSLSDIDDLKSRLMLLGSDANSELAEAIKYEKEYFLQMSEVILRLASAFVALCEAGDVTYLKWKKEVRCNIDKCKVHQTDIFEAYTEEVGKLEQRRQEWENALVELRLKHGVLNYFSVKQILYLQKHIFSLTLNEMDCQSLPAQVFTLLKFIDPDINSEKIKNAVFLSAALDCTDNKTEWTNIESDYPNFVTFSVDYLKTFVETLQSDHCIEENIAVASLIGVTPFIESRAVLWCDKQDSDDPHIDELFSKATNEFNKIESCMGSAPPSQDTSISVDANRPFMALGQFSLFLEELQEMNPKIRKRVVPDFLHKDKPNLLVLQKDDVLSSLLYFYSDNSSLPNADEVLICNEETKLEEIELLFLRAVFDPDGLYCLAFIDQINYTNSEEALQFLRRIMAEKTYCLVLFCAKQSEGSSYLAASLDSYQVYLPQGLEQEKLTSFVHRQIQVSSAVKKLNAAQIDSNRCNVRIIKSTRAGMGKTLFVCSCGSKLEKLMSSSKDYKFRLKRCVKKDTIVIIPVHSTDVNIEQIVNVLLEYEEKDDTVIPRIYHFDIAPTVSHGLDQFIFSLTILGSLKASSGKLWRRSVSDLCLIELTQASVTKVKEKESTLCSVIEILPTLHCSSPTDTCNSLRGNTVSERLLCDEKEFKGCPIQRVSQYLDTYSKNPAAVNQFTYKQDTPPLRNLACLQILLRYCGIPDPSWMELRNFVHFFNIQLYDCEMSAFTSPGVDQDLRGFKAFVIKFMLEMSKDFATRSLSMVDTSVGASGNALLQQHALQRRWEKSYHPYLFFNQDHVTMSFLGFCISPNGDLVDPDRNVVIQPRIMTPDLYADLRRQMGNDFLQLHMNFNAMTRLQKLHILCRVMGLHEIVAGSDPDPTYELTADNMKKMLAIHMRLRCGIPVVLMGETGCGKTRLIKFMCALRAGSNTVRNMILVKVHGGVTEKDIVARVQEAKNLAENNHIYGLSTVLFFDEANTTDAISLIKEIMVDKRMHGKSLQPALCGLEIIAACNPYRRHSEEMINKLDTAGLGYHVSGEKTYEKIGDIPLRELVYRVHPLPESMLPLVWDFGQLDSETERAYANQIILQYVNKRELPSMAVNLLVDILVTSQQYMRKQKDECSFVSLRDVERAVQVTAWFYKKMQLLKTIDSKSKDANLPCATDTDNVRKSLVLAVGVCYVARLENRDPYLEHIAPHFKDNFALHNGVVQMKEEIYNCQLLFVNELDLEPTIARNEALCENIFMMVVCIELRIPLFVVGKPGSSKSLAKTIIQDSMQGSSSKSELFKNFKQVFMSSYQCSPLSTAEGIIGTFRQCSRFQEKKDLNTFASVVVLDEVGLAEDSPKMPLKALHPLLEDGSDGSEDLTTGGAELKNKRVAFIGISNWSLDPAKMNRGIMLCRGDPDIKELTKTAMDICSSNPEVKSKIEQLIPSLAKSYAEICQKQKQSVILQQAKKEEFFALRDFYSLIKMIFSFALSRGDTPEEFEIEHSVKRNFSGLDDINTWGIFKENLGYLKDGINCSTVELIKSSFEDSSRNARYLLIMTEEYAAYNILMQSILKDRNDIIVIFGSSFPKDQEFTQICRDINRIKICMETGKSVVLLNMENLYESLYDVLNQYYVYLGGEQFVDLGLGTHRVKCKVDRRFKLIVIADKDTVYTSYPIPLINRLEKHFLVTSTSMSGKQRHLTDQLKQWAENFAVVNTIRRRFGPMDVFMGYNEDICASIVMNLLQNINYTEDQIIQEGKEILLRLATPDSVARASASLREVGDEIWNVYFQKQQHSSLVSFLETQLNNIGPEKTIIQVTTFSRLFTSTETAEFRLNNTHVEFLTLVQFQTEQSFREAVKKFLREERCCKSLLIVQCNNAAENPNLVACAQHICNELKNQYAFQYPLFMLFLLQLGYKKCGFKVIGVSQVACTCIHIDELRKPSITFPSLIEYVDQPLSCILDHEVAKEEEDVGAEVIDYEVTPEDILITVDNKDDIDADQDEVEDEDEDEVAVDQEKVVQAVSIIKSCLQASTKELNNIKPMTIKEVTNLIKTMTDMLSCHSNGEVGNFVIDIIKYIKKKLFQKEAEMYEPNNWIKNEAKDHNHLPNYGTFRQALIQCTKEKITPIITQLLLGINQFGNVMILQNEKYRELWLKLFHIFLPEELQIDNMNQLCTWTSKFPFFYELLMQTENVLKAHHTLELYDGTHLQNIFSSLKFSALLENVSEESIQDYIHDFVHIKFHGLDETIYQKLCDNLFLLTISTRNEEEIPLIQWVHVVYENNVNQKRLQHAAVLLKMFPHVEFSLDQNMFGREMVLDVFTLHEILAYLHLNECITSTVQTIAAWASKVKSLRSIYRSVVSCVLKYQENYGEKSLELAGYCRQSWMKARICQLFFDNISFTDVPDESRDAITSLAKNLDCIHDNTLTAASLGTIEGILITSISNCYEKESKNPIVYETYKSSCVAFFIDIVKEFVFEEQNGQQLSDDVITKLMTYVCSSTGTKKFSPIAEHALDPSPVIRSFLLKQLLESSKKVNDDTGDGGIDCHVEKYLKESICHVNNDPQSEWGVYIMFLHCYEDFFGEETAELKKVSDTLLINHISSCLQALIEEDIDEYPNISVDLLKRVANVRFVLSSTASILYSSCKVKEQKELHRFRKLFALLMKFISKVRNSEMHMFFLRQIIRQYGLRELDHIVKETEYTWLNLDREDKSHDVSHHADKYLIYGSRYKGLRDEITETLMADGKETEFAGIIEKYVSQGISLFQVSLVVAQECYLGLNMLNDQMKLCLMEAVVSEDFRKKLELLSTIDDVNIAEVLYHVMVLFDICKDHNLLQPFYLMANDPNKMKDSFFPAMPSDIIEEIGAGKPTDGTQWLVYSCPNGHRYVIGDCGRPYYRGNCNVCGAVIGGAGHVLQADNTTIEGFSDSSQPCHNLGSAANRVPYAVPERNLAPLPTAIQLFLVHTSLLYGVLTEHQQGIADLIQPRVTNENVQTFLWKHIQHDVEIIQDAIAKSKDDVYVMFHLLIKNIIELCTNEGNIQSSPFVLPLTKDSRKKFEEEFHQKLVMPILKNLSTSIEDTRKILLSDIRLGTNPLRRRLHEIDECTFVELKDIIPSTVPHFWSYRQPITIEHFKMAVQEEFGLKEGKTLQVLSTFLNQLPIFSHLKELPVLIELQKLLSAHLAFRLKRKQAQEMSMTETIQQYIPKANQKKVRKGILQLIKMWRELYPFVVAHARFRYYVREIPENLNMKSPLVHFLHTQDTVSIPLITFLVSYQNEFLDQCAAASTKSMERHNVVVLAVKEEDVIKYGKDDLYSLIYTHCDHSYEMGGRSKIQYNMNAAEKDLINDILYDSTKIDMKSDDLTFSYVDDVYHSQLFSMLHKKVHQKEIPFHEQKRMMRELLDIAAVSNSLRAIEIAVGILSSTGGDPNQMYKDYLANVLIMDVNVVAPGGLMQNLIRLSHLHSAWTMLIVERAKRLHSNNEQPFDIEYNRMETLDGNTIETLRSSLKHVDSDKWLAFISEFIMLQLPNIIGNDRNLSFSLRETFEYVGDTGRRTIVDSKLLPLDLIPEVVEIKHVYSLWEVMLTLNEEMHKA